MVTSMIAGYRFDRETQRRRFEQLGGGGGVSVNGETGVGGGLGIVKLRARAPCQRLLIWARITADLIGLPEGS